MRALPHHGCGPSELRKLNASRPLPPTKPKETQYRRLADLLWVMTALSCAGPAPSPKYSDTPAKPTPPARQVVFQTAETWPIPNGGTGRVVVIDPKNRNEADLRALGEQLRGDARGDRNSVVSIYDDQRAARMRGDYPLDRLSKTDEAFYTKHWLGEYSKNGNTGHHELLLWPNGQGTAMVKVVY